MNEERREKEKIEENQCSISERQPLNQNESCFMALEETKITYFRTQCSEYTFDELQDAFKELAIEFEKMNLKYKRMISKFNVENEFLMKTKVDLERQNEKLKLNFESSQKRIENLENENLSLKEKCEGLINGHSVLFKNISNCFMAKEIWEKFEHMYAERREEEQIEENQCSTNDKAKYKESSRSQSSNEKESCLMAIEELEVTSNSCDSTHTFEELQDAFKELAIEFEKMNLKYKKMIFKFNVENEFLIKIKIDLERQN